MASNDTTDDATADLARTSAEAGPVQAAEQPPAPKKRAPRKRASRAVSAPEASPADAPAADAAAGQELSPRQPAAETATGDTPPPAPKKRTARKRASRAVQTPAVEFTETAVQADSANDATTAQPSGSDDDVAIGDVALAVVGSEQLHDLLSSEDDEQDSGPDDSQPSAPVVPTFGLLFQAPEPAKVSRRATRPATSPVDTQPALETDAADETVADVEDMGDVDDTPRGRRRSRGRARGRGDVPRDDAHDDTTDDDSDTAEALEENDDTGDGAGRRRRRRGGKGRRRDEAADDTESTDTSDDDAAGQDDADEPSDTDDSTSGGRKRTRRRRRSGSSTESDDPPGTVTRVREPRKDRDEATGIKGSTRLEAKRQRRREGREAGRRRTIITEAEFLARRESVERTMVVRQQGERTQIGVLEDGVLVEHYISAPGSTSHTSGSSMAGNVYLGRVQNVLPSMEAAFVDIGKGRNAVLYAGEVNWDAAGLEQHKSRRIENALSSGQSVLVQVTKDPIGHKGARLTSQVSLPGRYLVYVPEGSMTGISRKLPDTERARLKKILKEIVPENAGVIVRTAAEGASEKELTADVERLQKEWERISKKAKSGNAPVLLHGEPDLTVRVVRDVFNEDFSSLVVSGDEAWDTVSDYVHSVAPDLADRVSRWTGEKDVFAAHRIDEQLAKAMDRKVWLPSGGSLVIDRTEAMTVVDVNTGKFTGAGGNLEETVTKNNLEAAEEIVRQLRLRDVGGIIVIDFIDMVLEANRDLVVRRLLECLGRDRTKHQVAEVTSLGLVQMTRKRVGAGLIEVFSEPCENCNGRGLVIQSEPVDRAPTSGDREGAGGRGRGRGRARGKDVVADDQREMSSESPAPSGPTPAQIAAAAYAAAVQAGSHAVDEGDVPSTARVEEVTQAIEATLDRAAGESATPAATTPGAPKVTGRAPRRASSRGTATVEAVVPSASAPVDAEPDAPAPQSTPAARAPRPRRSGRRAATSGPTTPAGTADVVTVAADEGGSTAVQEALAAAAAPTTSGSGATSSTRTRRRARVVAPAGAPGEVRSATQVPESD